MNNQKESRKDPALRYLWGLIHDLEIKMKEHEERQKIIDKELNDIKHSRGG